MRKYFSALVVLLFATPVFAAPKIAVVDFDSHQYSAQLPGAQLADFVMDELVNTGLFDVIERDKLDSVMREIGFGQSGMVDPSSAAQFGRLLGAGYLLTGRVVSLESSQRKFSGYGINTTNTILTLSVAIRITDVQTGTVKFSTRTSTQATINEAGGLSVRETNPYAGLAEQAAVEMVQEIQDSGRFAVNPAGGAPQSVPIVKVTVMSNPDGADVEVDGVFYGNAGGEIKIPSGLRRIRVSLAGYEPWEKQVMVSENSKFTATLAPVREQ